jgi:predicted RNA binding protein YcfA (HicA-like mRNA interferase family)
MPRLRTLSGAELLKVFASAGFQRGSHIKLRRTLPDGNRQTLTIVTHSEIDRGTLHAIIDKPFAISQKPNCARTSTLADRLSPDRLNVQAISGSEVAQLRHYGNCMEGKGG